MAVPTVLWTGWFPILRLVHEALGGFLLASGVRPTSTHCGSRKQSAWVGGGVKQAAALLFLPAAPASMVNVEGYNFCCHPMPGPPVIPGDASPGGGDSEERVQWGKGKCGAGVELGEGY